mgnify:CR=1 FL=1
MNTENEKDVKEIAWHNIDICCQTLCDNQVVMTYIKQLEKENETLRQMIACATKYRLL